MRKPLLVASIPCFLILLESVIRINAPEYARPSTIITACATFISEWAYYIGQQIGCFTDIWYIVKEYFGKDMYALFVALCKLFESPWYMAKGYFTYYTESTTPFWFVLITIVLAVIVLFYFNFHRMDAMQAKANAILDIHDAVAPFMVFSFIAAVCAILIVPLSKWFEHESKHKHSHT